MLVPSVGLGQLCGLPPTARSQLRFRGFIWASFQRSLGLCGWGVAIPSEAGRSRIYSTVFKCAVVHSLGQTNSVPCKEPEVLTRALSFSLFYLALAGCVEPGHRDTGPGETDADSDADADADSDADADADSDADADADADADTTEVAPGTYAGPSSGEILFETNLYSCQGNASVTVDSGGLGSGEMNCNDEARGVDCAIAFDGYDINAAATSDVVFDCYMSQTGALSLYSVGDQLHISANLTVSSDSFEYDMVAIATRTD